MTAVEDFSPAAADSVKWSLPVDFVAMVVDEARARLTPKIAALFDRFESASGRESKVGSPRTSVRHGRPAPTRAAARLRVKNGIPGNLELLKSACSTSTTSRKRCASNT